MTEKRQRKNNWTQLENQKLEKALQLFGRADIQKVVDYLRENLSDFNRSFKDVKKKIYNQLQEDVLHEISVKENSVGTTVLQRLSKFSGHNTQRIEQNMSLLKDNMKQLSIGVNSIRKIASENHVQDLTTLLMENHLYKKLLCEFKNQLD